MMRNRQIAMGFVCSGLSLGWALPGVAQQVMLTPVGTMFAPMPVVETPNVLPGAPIPPTSEGAAPSPANTQATSYVGAYPPGTEVADIPFMGKATVLAYDDPRLPAAIRGIAYGKDYYWAAQTAIDSAGNSQTQIVLARIGGGWDSILPENLPNVLQKLQASKIYSDAQNFLSSPAGEAAKRQQLQMIISNPEIYSFHPGTWGKPVKDVVDVNGNVLIRKDEIIANRVREARYQLGEFSGFARNAEWTVLDEYESLGYIPEQVATRPNMLDLNGNVVGVRPDFQPGTLLTEPISAEFYRNLSGNNGMTLSAVSMDSMNNGENNLTIVENLPDLTVPSVVATPIAASVDVPIVENLTRTIVQPAPQTIMNNSPTLVRNSVTEALQLRAESPLSQSRIMPGFGN